MTLDGRMTFTELVIDLWNRGYSVEHIVENVEGDKEKVEYVVKNSTNCKKARRMSSSQEKALKAYEKTKVGMLEKVKARAEEAYRKAN